MNSVEVGFLVRSPLHAVFFKDPYVGGKGGMKLLITILISDFERLRGPVVLLGKVCLLIFNMTSSITVFSLSSNFKK